MTFPPMFDYQAKFRTVACTNRQNQISHLSHLSSFTQTKCALKYKNKDFIKKTCLAFNPQDLYYRILKMKKIDYLP